MCKGAGRNDTAITNPVVSVSRTTAATQLTFYLKARTHQHTHKQTHTHRHTDTSHISSTFPLKRRQRCSLPFHFMLSPIRVHVAGLVHIACLSFCPLFSPFHQQSDKKTEGRHCRQLHQQIYVCMYKTKMCNASKLNRMCRLYFERSTGQLAVGLSVMVYWSFTTFSTELVCSSQELCGILRGRDVLDVNGTIQVFIHTWTRAWSWWEMGCV